MVDIVTTNGLAATVVEYEDSTDRDVREAWNIAKHDKETLAVRFSILYVKINIARKRYAKTPDWATVRKWLRDSIWSGSSAKDSINRWVRAASQMDGEVVEAIKDLQWLRGNRVWDNEYLMGVAS